MDPIFARFCAGAMLAPRPMLSVEEILDPARAVSREEQLHRFGSAAYTLYWQAERVRKLGISWRNFCVGCAMWAYRKDASLIEDKWRAFCGMNTKVEQGSTISVRSRYHSARHIRDAIPRSSVWSW